MENSLVTDGVGIRIPELFLAADRFSDAMNEVWDEIYNEIVDKVLHEQYKQRVRHTVLRVLGLEHPTDGHNT